MKTFLFALFLLSTPIVQAQTIGDEALRRAQQGEVSFLEGEFIAYLADTVSPGYAEREMNRQGFVITSNEIKPIKIQLLSALSDSTLHQLRAHPQIRSVEYVESSVDSVSVRNSLTREGMTEEQFNTMADRIIESMTEARLILTFRYSVDEKTMKSIMGLYRNTAYRVIQNYPRTVNIKAEPGKEPELMQKVEQLPFVTSTAMIAVLEN